MRSVLASRDVEIEVIVIDDGSKDRTSAIVRAAFADEPRVRLLTLENGGKARALNRGLDAGERRDRDRARRRHAVRADHDRAARALVRRPAARRGRGQCQGRQPRQSRHALAGAGIYHRAEPRAARARRGSTR